MTDLQFLDSLTPGWTESKNGMLCNSSLSGGIIDFAIVSKKWFIIFNDDRESIEELDNREEAIRQFMGLEDLEKMTDQDLEDEFAIGDYCLERLSTGLFSVLDWDAQLCNKFAQRKGPDPYHWELDTDGVTLCSGTFLDVYNYIKAGWAHEFYD